jgi:hypothetical protein
MVTGQGIMSGQRLPAIAPKPQTKKTEAGRALGGGRRRGEHRQTGGDDD